MSLARDTFCSFCGTKYDVLTYPRTCPGCKTQVWANPIPVCVALVPIVTSEGTGLLTIRRAIPPAIGMLALVGGFLEEHESWQTGCAREVREETGIEIDASKLVPFWYASSEPKPNRVMLFAVAQELRADALPPFAPDSETSARGVILGPAGLEEVFAFTTHIEAARRFFAERGVARMHGFFEL
ncbi:MAG TPA: NUDIX domain-containing protein [Kofleriaceae bacterium]|nr:NUDIX domain-containing protein [Kofleriaceae bacterium]